MGLHSSPDGYSDISETFAHLVLGYRFQPIKKDLPLERSFARFMETAFFSLIMKVYPLDTSSKGITIKKYVLLLFCSKK